MAHGLVCHTLNPRLFLEQLVYIAGHAGDKWLLVDADLLPLAARLVERVPCIAGLIVLADAVPAHDRLRVPVLCYETLLAAEALPADPLAFPWHGTDERADASLCFTSGTTGNPKGVVYTHRSLTLHAMAVVTPDCMCLSSKEVALMIVPAFHANGWSILSAALISGCTLVLPGAHLDGRSVFNLILSQKVTLTAGVPTVFMGLLAHLADTPGATLGTLRRVIVGGAAVPPSMLRTFEEKYGVTVQHAYGLTETSPMLTLNTPKGALPRSLAQALKQGRAPFTVELRLVDDAGAELPWDGFATGNLQARGPAVLRRYLALPPALVGGWFDTGDVACIDSEGFVQICDRKKDLIKSGGEWLSSVDVEGATMSLPGLAQAACIGVPDAKWGERPAILAVAKAGARVSAADVVAHLRGSLAKWQLPEERHVFFVDALLLTATGKFDKKAMREWLQPGGKLHRQDAKL